jgi:hypothetical protein
MDRGTPGSGRLRRATAGLRRLFGRPRTRVEAIAGLVLSLAGAVGFGAGALVAWGDVPPREQLQPVSGVVTRVQVRQHRYGHTTRFWIGDVRLYYEGSLEGQLERGARIEAQVFRYHEDRPTLHVYELAVDGRPIVTYEGYVRRVHRLAIFCGAFAAFFSFAGLGYGLALRRLAGPV